MNVNKINNNDFLVYLHIRVKIDDYKYLPFCCHKLPWSVSELSHTLHLSIKTFSSKSSDTGFWFAVCFPMVLFMNILYFFLFFITDNNDHFTQKYVYTTTTTILNKIYLPTQLQSAIFCRLNIQIQIYVRL